MSDPKIKGTVHLVEETKTYGQKGFRKRLVVIEQDNGRFTNYVPVEFTNDRCDAVNELKVGDQIEVTYRLNGRKWQKDPTAEVKFFLNAEAIDFTVTGATARQARPKSRWLQSTINSTKPRSMTTKYRSSVIASEKRCMAPLFARPASARGD